LPAAGFVATDDFEAGTGVLPPTTGVLAATADLAAGLAAGLETRFGLHRRTAERAIFNIIVDHRLTARWTNWKVHVR
jgi:hypothetical protein